MIKRLLTGASILSILVIILVACKKDTSSTSSGTSSASITALNCSSATVSGTITAGTAFSGTVSVPYTGGNGAAYSAGSGISSTGITGLTATLSAGTLASGAGSLSYSISGTASGAGTASFALSFGGQTCTLSVTVSSSTTTSSCDALSGVSQIVCLAEAFKATLSSSQLSAVQLDYTFSNIKTWSNLPAAMSARLGISTGSMSTAQLTAFKALVKAMSGQSTANEGWDEVQQLWYADDYLYSVGGGSSYGSGNYYIAFFGTPSTTGKFEIMMTGHHKTVANTYSAGSLVAATPHFAAVEPLSFTWNGATYAPINQEKDAFVAILASLSSSELSTAKSSSTYTDLILAPGKDWQFPTTYTGLQVGTLSSDKKTLVLNAIKTYVNDISDAEAATILALYTSELDNTYVTYSGTTAMSTKNDYIRIDGPHVWIEFSVQGGIILSGVHYHSIWRDRVSDYAGTK